MIKYLSFFPSPFAAPQGREENDYPNAALSVVQRCEAKLLGCCFVPSISSVLVLPASGVPAVHTLGYVWDIGPA